MGLDKSCTHVTVSSTPWLAIIQFALLVIHYGHIATLPWWLVWLPVLIFVLEIFLVVIVLGAILVYAVAESIFDNGVIDAVCVSGGVVIIIYALMWVWGFVTAFFSGLV